MADTYLEVAVASATVPMQGGFNQLFEAGEKVLLTDTTEEFQSRVAAGDTWVERLFVDLEGTSDSRGPEVAAGFTGHDIGGHIRSDAGATAIAAGVDPEEHIDGLNAAQDAIVAGTGEASSEGETKTSRRSKSSKAETEPTTEESGTDPASEEGTS